ncbi:MAG: DNA primase [Proteobacteria bacterium CG1_02_64_396]|nr:MAG: DNA primase [Proteobacteria bacterium CG1_02_64_396]
MARLPDSYIDQVLARSDLESLIGQSVELKRQGRNLTGLCPFHTEKSPSFSVNPDKGVYYCFGCGASGNAVSFLMNREGLSFREAVLQLGERAGISPPQEDGPDPYEGLREVMARSHRLFVKNLEGEEGRAARQYLDERGIGPEVRKEYRLGFAPDAWDRLVLELGPRDAPKGEVAGVVVRNEAGRLYDRFRSRIIIPITDDRGRLVSFGGRIVGAGEPKYLNGPESPLFHKGELLYGLHEALPAIRKERRAIVVEGYFDRIALAVAGIGEAVAPLGTALTQEQIERLWRACDTVVLCFDGDNAGRRAAWRGLERALPTLKEGRRLRFLFLPEGEDPDTLVRQEGAQRFRTRLDEAIPPEAFAWTMVIAEHGEDAEGMAAAAAKLKGLADQSASPILGQAWRMAWAKRLNWPIHLLGGQSEGQAPAVEAKPAPSMKPRPAPSMRYVRRYRLSEDEQFDQVFGSLLHLLVMEEEAWRAVDLERVFELGLPENPWAGPFEELVEAQEKGVEPQPARWLGHLSQDRPLPPMPMMNEGVEVSVLARELANRVAVMVWKRHIQHLSALYQQDPKANRDLWDDISELQRLCRNGLYPGQTIRD